MWRGLPDAPGLLAGTALAVVARDATEESPSRIAELAGDAGVPVVLSGDAWHDYDVPGAPFFVLVRDGRVAGQGTATSWPQVRELLGRADADAGAGSATGVAVAR